MDELCVLCVSTCDGMGQSKINNGLNPPIERTTAVAGTFISDFWTSSIDALSVALGVGPGPVVRGSAPPVDPV